MKKLKKEEKNKSQLIIIGSFILIIISIILFLTSYLKDRNVEETNKEKLIKFYEIQDEIINEEDTKQNEVIINKSYENYIGSLIINEIYFERGFYSIDSKSNNVNKNIEVLKESNMPDEQNGNLIIAGHSGNSSVSFFKNLYKLEKGDKATVIYKGKSYEYILNNYYEIDKTGTAEIIRDNSKSTLTLITCKKNSKKQYIFIFYML